MVGCVAGRGDRFQAVVGVRFHRLAIINDVGIERRGGKIWTGGPGCGPRRAARIGAPVRCLLSGARRRNGPRASARPVYARPRAADRPQQRFDVRRIGRARVEDRKAAVPDQKRVRAVEGEGAGVRRGDPPHARRNLDRLAVARLEIAIEVKAMPQLLAGGEGVSIGGGDRAEGAIMNAAVALNGRWLAVSFRRKGRRARGARRLCRSRQPDPLGLGQDQRAVLAGADDAADRRGRSDRRRPMARGSAWRPSCSISSRGIAGLPGVHRRRRALAYLLGPTGGFLIGFAPAALHRRLAGGTRLRPQPAHAVRSDGRRRRRRLPAGLCLACVVRDALVGAARHRSGARHSPAAF